jgi:hypothetical protein
MGGVLGKNVSVFFGILGSDQGNYLILEDNVESFIARNN